MAEPIRTEHVAALGTRKTIAHVNRGARGSGFEEIELPVYPDSPEGAEFRRARVAARVTLGEAARRLGLSMVYVSELERGARRPAAGTTWDDITRVALGGKARG